MLVADLVRVGESGSAGYVATARAIDTTDLLLSFGLGDDCRFEELFQHLSGARVLCYDASTGGLSWVRQIVRNTLAGRWRYLPRYFKYRRLFRRQDAEHRKLMVGYDRPGFVSLDTILAEFPERRIFLKMDIDGGEYRVLDSIVRHQDRFTGISMELHDIDIHRDRLTRFFADLDHFAIVAINANNVGGADPAGDPIVIELALGRRDAIDVGDGSIAGNTRLPNDASAPDLQLTFGARR